MGRKAFTDFIQIRNLREGSKVDGKVVSLYFDLVVGAFTIKGVSWQPVSGSIRLNLGPRLQIKGSYVKTIRRMAVEAVKELRKKELEKRNAEFN
jgi:hypothetical protein